MTDTDLFYLAMLAFAIGFIIGFILVTYAR
jgi:hypothetical protein